MLYRKSVKFFCGRFAVAGWLVLTFTLVRAVHGQDELPAGFRLLEIAAEIHQKNKDATKHHDHRTQNCQQAGVALKELERGLDAAHEALVHFRKAELEPGDEFHHLEAVFFQMSAWSEIGDMIRLYNIGSQNNPEKWLGQRVGAARAYGKVLDLLEKLEPEEHQLEEFRPLIPFYKGNALAQVGEIDQAEPLLRQFVEADQSPDDPYRNAATDTLKKIGPKVAAHKLQDGDHTKSTAKPEAPKFPPLIGKGPDRALRCEDLDVRESSAVLPPVREGKESATARDDGTENVPFYPRFSLGVSSGVGIDGNPTHLGRSVATPPTLAGRAAVFNDSSLTAQVDWYFAQTAEKDTRVDKLTLFYLADHLFYDLHHASDTLVQTGRLSYAHAFAERLAGVVLVSDTWIRNDEATFSNSQSIQPGLVIQLTPSLTIQPAFNEVFNKYYLTAGRTAGLSGITHIPTLLASATLLAGKRSGVSPMLPIPLPLPTAVITLEPNYSHRWNVTEGIANDYQRDDIQCKFTALLFKAEDTRSFLRELALAGSYEYYHDHHEHPTPTGPREASDAHLFEVDLILKMCYDEKVPDRFDVTLKYLYSRQFSDLVVRDYSDPVFLASLKYNF